MAGQMGKGAGLSRWWALAPFGRLGHALGFRWLFWWTLPIPYHPVLPILLVLAPLILLGLGAARVIAGGAAPASWTSFLFAGLVLAIPLSVPILNMMFLALRVQWLQGLCVLAAMLLLPMELAAGRAAPALGVLPLLYFLAHIWQLVTSRAVLARLERAAARYRPIELAGRPVALRGEQLWSEAQALLATGVTNIACCDDAERTGSGHLAGNTALLVEPEAAEQFRKMLPKAPRPTGWGVVSANILQVPGWVAEPEVRVAWTPLPRRQTGPSGHLVTIADGHSCQEVVVGAASAVMPIPLFFLFYMLAWSGGRSFWVAGFWRGKMRPIGPGASAGRRGVTRGLFAAADSPVGPVDAAPHLAQLAREQEAMLAEARAELLRYMAGEIRWPQQVRRLQVRPSALSGLAVPLCDHVERAKERADEAGAKLGAELLALIGDEEFQSSEQRLLSILGSRILALRWELTPDLDLTPLPKLCPRFGNHAGFGLMDKVPQLWTRLGELGPRAARVTALLIKEVGEQPMLAAAKARFEARGIELPIV